MKNFSFKTLSGGGITRVIIISLFATLACAGIIKAATTIGTNISTDGTLFATGQTTLGNASSTALTVSGNTWLATTTLSGSLDLLNNIISNIGAAGTDFTSTGGLTLADLLTISSGGMNITGTSTVTGNLYWGGDYFLNNGETNVRWNGVLPLQRTWTTSTTLKTPFYSGNNPRAQQFDEPFCMKQNGTYYCFYEYKTGSVGSQRWNIGMAHTTDLTSNWTVVEPILAPTENSGDPDQEGCADPVVLYIPWAEHPWHMWFDMFQDAESPNYAVGIGHAYSDNGTSWTKQDLNPANSVTDVVAGGSSTRFDSFSSTDQGHAPEAFLVGGVVHLIVNELGTGHTQYDAIEYIANDKQGLGYSFAPYKIVTLDDSVSSGTSNRFQSVFYYQGVLYSQIYDGSSNYWWVTSSDNGKSWQQIGFDSLSLHSFFFEGTRIYGVGNLDQYFSYLDLASLNGTAAQADNVLGNNISIPIMENVKRGYYVDNAKVVDGAYCYVPMPTSYYIYDRPYPDFDGSNDTYSGGDPADGSLDMGTNDFAVAVWFKTDSVSSTVGLVTKTNANIDEPGTWALHLEGTVAKLTIKDSNNNTITSGASGLSVDSLWHHLFAWVDYSTATTYFYLDGVLVDSDTGTLTGNFNNAYTFRIAGVGNTATKFYNGKLMNVRIYRGSDLSSAMTATNVLFNFQAPGKVAQSMEQYLIGKWDMNEGGNFLYDSSGVYKNDLTGAGGLSWLKTERFKIPSDYTTAPSAITPGASPYIYQNTSQYNVAVIISGGTVTQIDYSRDGSTYYTVGVLTGGMFGMSPYDYLKITYTDAPTMTLVPR